MSNLEQKIKGSVKQVEFEKKMENLKKNVEDLVRLVQTLEENIPKSDDVARGTHEN